MRDSKFTPTCGERLRDPVDDRGEGHAARCVRLRIEENLYMYDSLFVGFAQVRPGERVKIFFVAQHCRARVIHIEKGLQIGKLIGVLQRLHRGIPQFYCMLLGEVEHHLRFERALDVQMQLRFRKRANEVFDGMHGIRSSALIVVSSLQRLPRTN